MLVPTTNNLHTRHTVYTHQTERTRIAVVWRSERERCCYRLPSFLARGNAIAQLTGHTAVDREVLGLVLVLRVLIFLRYMGLEANHNPLIA